MKNHHLLYKIAAPTGRAARILGRKAKTTTSTIHSLIYKIETNDETGKVNFKLKLQQDASPTIYIIDESSMISRSVNGNNDLFETENGLLVDLIHFVKRANVDNKIIFLGDHYQLSPVGESQSYALNKDFLEKTFNLQGNSYFLTEVKRQEDGSYILENATDIRKAIDLGKTSHTIQGIQSRSIYSAAESYVKDTASKGFENSIDISVSHKANKFFNDLVREKIFGRTKQILENGDLLMVSQNWSRNGSHLYNGDHVLLQSVDWTL